MAYKALDISYANGTLDNSDFHGFAAAGVKLVIAKASQGSDHPYSGSLGVTFGDSSWNRGGGLGNMYLHSIDSRLTAGAYHFCTGGGYAGSSQAAQTTEGTDQADFFIGQFPNNDPKGYACALDVEVCAYTVAGVVHRYAQDPTWFTVLAFLKRFKHFFPHHPMHIYSTPYQWKKLMGGNHSVAGYADGFWNALLSYGTHTVTGTWPTVSSKDRTPNSAGFKAAELVQWGYATQSGNTYDADLFYGTTARLARMTQNGNPATAPTAPRKPVATAGVASASVAFNEPSSTGGAFISGYTATSTPGGHTGTASASPINVTGLSNGTAYTFKVKATNSAGTSPWSAVSNSVTPAASPPPPPPPPPEVGVKVRVLLQQGSTAISAATKSISNLVHVESLKIAESGNHEPATCDMEIIDRTLAYAAMRGEWRMQVFYGGTSIFRGFTRQNPTKIEGIYGGIAVTGYDVSTLLDRIVSATSTSRKRAKNKDGSYQKGESDKARLQWAFKVWGGPIVSEGFTDWTQVQTLADEMPDQTFGPGLTLRQVVERILSAASDSANYYFDAVPRLHTFDDSFPEHNNYAPYDINVANPLDDGEIAPEDLEQDWDSDSLRNFYWVNGSNAASSGSISDPVSIGLFGKRAAALDVPDGDDGGPMKKHMVGSPAKWDGTYVSTKTRQVALAALHDTTNPIPRGSLTVTGARCSDADGHRWQAGQLVYITSAVHGLTGRDTDTGPWSWHNNGGLGLKLQPFRISRLTTSFDSGRGARRMEIELGGRRLSLYKS